MTLNYLSGRHWSSRSLIATLLLALFVLLMSSGRAQELETYRAKLPDQLPTESAEQAAMRHRRVAQRREGVAIICHRGSLEFAHENTLEAYEATFQLGGDGNEIDIRGTRDGVLVCFHDDMLDRLLEAYGTVREKDWNELRQFPFREPGNLGKSCRIPTLVEVLELHRRHAGLLHLDIKEPGLDESIATLIDRLDMWDHIAFCGESLGGSIAKNPKFKSSRYKGGLYLDRGEVDPKMIAAVLARPGDAVIVEDPRGVLVATNRAIGEVPPRSKPAVEEVKVEPLASGAIDSLVKILSDADDWKDVAESPEEQKTSGERIRARAIAAEELFKHRVTTTEAMKALEERVRQRSFHKHWMYHGLDGAMALRTLILLRTPNAVKLARTVLWSNDPELHRVYNPQYNTPQSWTDFRLKMQVFPSLREMPGAESEALCREYLALTDEAANAIGPPQFEEAARTLLVISPSTETALELMRHRRSEVRGRAMLICLSRYGDPWARHAIAEGAPHAMEYLAER